MWWPLGSKVGNYERSRVSLPCLPHCDVTPPRSARVTVGATIGGHNEVIPNTLHVPLRLDLN